MSHACHGTHAVASRLTQLRSLALWTDSGDHRVAPFPPLSGAGGGAPDPAQYKALLQGAMRVTGSLDWRDTGDWARHAYDAIDALADLIEHCPRDAVKLAEYALKRCDTVYQRVDDSGEITMLINRAEQIHRDATSHAGEQPVKLAARLYKVTTSSDLDILIDAYTTHADALGTDGRAHYRSLALQDWAQLRDVTDSDDWAMRHLRSRVLTRLARIARADRDAEATVEFIGDGFPYSGRYAEVAKALIEIDDLDAALDWCERGIAAAPTDYRIHAALVEAQLRRGHPKLALEPAWEIFEQTVAPKDFDRLRSCAEAARSWKTWRRRAFAHAHSVCTSRDGDATRLVTLHLHVDEVEDARTAASEHGCADHLRLELAELREIEHPVDSARIYLARIDDALGSMSKRRYDETIALLSRAHALLAGDAERKLFHEAVARIRDLHRRKRTLMAKLDARGW